MKHFFFGCIWVAMALMAFVLPPHGWWCDALGIFDAFVAVMHFSKAGFFL
jgi:hypothetical protein